QCGAYTAVRSFIEQCGVYTAVRLLQITVWAYIAVRSIFPNSVGVHSCLLNFLGTVWGVHSCQTNQFRCSSAALNSI
ncbi:26505_t:CDS:1, partial [Racocetra persica]